MTKQEVKEEIKSSEGDPLLRGAMRSRALAISRNRMMADVPTADVVVVNPTHVAVALKYDPAKGAPRVVAKGGDHIAARIRELAERAPGADGGRHPAGPHAVPDLRDRPGDPGRPVPGRWPPCWPSSCGSSARARRPALHRLQRQPEPAPAAAGQRTQRRLLAGGSTKRTANGDRPGGPPRQLAVAAAESAAGRSGVVPARRSDRSGYQQQIVAVTNSEEHRAPARSPSGAECTMQQFCLHDRLVDRTFSDRPAASGRL